MTDETIDAIGYFRKIANEWNEDGLNMSASYMADAANTIERELRRCRAETLREAARIVERYFVAENATEELDRMADEAEKADDT